MPDLSQRPRKRTRRGVVGRGDRCTALSIGSISRRGNKQWLRGNTRVDKALFPCRRFGIGQRSRPRAEESACRTARTERIDPPSRGKPPAMTMVRRPLRTARERLPGRYRPKPCCRGRVGPAPNSPNLRVGGTADDNRAGKLLVRELDAEEDFFGEWHDGDDLVGLCRTASDDSGALTSSDDSGNDDDSDGAETAIPVVDATVDEGPGHRLAQRDRIVPAACGPSVAVWDHRRNARPETAHASSSRLARIETVPTNDSLTPRCKVARCASIDARFVAAAGSGESAMVRDRESRSPVRYLPLPRHPSGCCLATGCIVTPDWFRDDSGILVSGGCDGVVTLRTVANRLEQLTPLPLHEEDHRCRSIPSFR